MRAVIQRVGEATVSVDGGVQASIGPGLLVLLGVETGDTVEEADWLADKIVRLRVFPDDAGVMNLGAVEVGAEVMVVSQFTLLASTRKGNRPSYLRAAQPPEAVPLYERVVARIAAGIGRPVATGRFGASMRVALVNEGPVTITIDTRLKE